MQCSTQESKPEPLNNETHYEKYKIQLYSTKNKQKQNIKQSKSIKKTIINFNLFGWYKRGIYAFHKLSLSYYLTT